ncbi:hypothetical protein IAI21_10970, partial [Streptococcus pseudopneumoniae]|uniref:hypothetical protein n=1 Tax=Streptococcus pseudopneumoniae TaxID=257758 RepID=UPI0018B058E0
MPDSPLLRLARIVQAMVSYSSEMTMADAVRQIQPLVRDIEALESAPAPATGRTITADQFDEALVFVKKHRDVYGMMGSHEITECI